MLDNHTKDFGPVWQEAPARTLCEKENLEFRTIEEVRTVARARRIRDLRKVQGATPEEQEAKIHAIRHPAHFCTIPLLVLTIIAFQYETVAEPADTFLLVLLTAAFTVYSAIPVFRYLQLLRRETTVLNMQVSYRNLR